MGETDSQQLVGLSGLLHRRLSCKYCLFEDILPEDFRRSAVLVQPLPPNHVKRLVIEELCSSEDGGDVDCPMKYAAMHYFEDEKMALQWDCVEMFKNDRGIEWLEAWGIWTALQSNGVNYAQRFAQVYSIGKDYFTTKRMHDLVVASQETYDMSIAIEIRLNKERMERIRVRESRR